VRSAVVGAPAGLGPDSRSLAYWLLCGFRPRRLKHWYALAPRLSWVIREAKKTAMRQIFESRRNADEYVYRYYRLALDDSLDQLLGLVKGSVKEAPSDDN
jgi:hypothetical protein